MHTKNSIPIAKVNEKMSKTLITITKKVLDALVLLMIETSLLE